MQASLESAQGVTIKINYTYVQAGNKITTELISTEASGPVVEANPDYKKEIEARSADRIGRKESVTFVLEGEKMIVTTGDGTKMTMTRVK